MISGMVTFPISLVVLLLVSACEAIPAIKSDVNQNERHNIAKRSTYADYYEAVIPDILIDDWTGSVYKVKFTLDAQSILYKVKMKRNRDLIRPGAEILRKQATQDTTEYLPYNNHMHFTGTVEKKDTNGTLIATGQAAFLQKNGFYGSMFVDGEEIKVEPTIRSNTSTLNDEHIVFPAVEVEDDLSHDMVAIEAVDTVSQARKKRTPPDTQYVELLATIDYDVWSEFGDAAIDHVLMRINMAQALFQHSSLVSNGFNIYFIVVKIVTIENNQIMTQAGVSTWDDILDLFSFFVFDWESTYSDYSYDIAMVIGGSSITNSGDDNAVSSYKACSPDSHVIAIRYQDNDHMTRLLARQFALGLGMGYDNSSCVDPGILSDVNKLHFSECNRDAASAYLSSIDGSCFENNPDPASFINNLPLATELDKLNYDCYVEYADHATHFSEEACPWHRTYDTFTCQLWCLKRNRIHLGTVCENTGRLPSYSAPTCGNNQLCDSQQSCYCPSGEDCTNSGDAAGREDVGQYISVDVASFQNAESECTAHGGAIADIRNSSIESGIVNDVATPDTTNDLFYFATRRESSTGQQWFSQGAVPGYLNWNAGEPDTDENECLVLSRTNGFKMTDNSCSPASAIGAICEIYKDKPLFHWVAPSTYAYVGADGNCQNYGGRLAKLATSGVQTRVADVFAALTVLPSTNKVFFDAQLDGTLWKYTDGHELRYSDTNWRSGEPDNLKSCAVVKITDNKWQSDDCTLYYGRFHICEFDCIPGASSLCHNGDIVVNENALTCECVCDAGWEGPFCLQPIVPPPMYYKAVSVTEEFYDAKQICSDLGGGLATVQSPGMLQNVGDVATDNELVNDVWVGLFEKDGIWMSDDSTPQSGFTTWNNEHPKDKECGAIKFDTTWQMFGVTCTFKKEYICEFRCDQGSSWCIHGSIVNDTVGCHCECDYTWSGEFCTVRTDTMLSLTVAGKYDTVKADCESHQGRLALINSAADQQRVADYLQTASPPDNRIYFGLTKAGESGLWLNEYGNQLFFNFKNTPNIYTETCVTIREDFAYEWKSIPCNWAGGRIGLCEFDCTSTAWCPPSKGTVVSVGSTCYCDCKPGFSGQFCDEQKKRKKMSSPNTPDQTGSNANTNGNLVTLSCPNNDVSGGSCSLRLLNCEFIFDLHINEDLIVPNALWEMVQDVREEGYVPENRCHYLGSVQRQCRSQDDVSGRIALSVCGEKTHSGTILLEDGTRYVIQAEEAPKGKLQGKYRMFENQQDRRLKKAAVFTDDDTGKIPAPPQISYASVQEVIDAAVKTAKLRQVEFPSETLIHLEVAVTVDYELYQKYGEESTDFALSIINHVQFVFGHQSLTDYGIFIMIEVVKVEIFKSPVLEREREESQWSDIATLFNMFCNVVEPTFYSDDPLSRQHYDVAILIADRDSVIDTGKGDALASFQSCNGDRCAVLLYSTDSDFEHPRSLLSHLLGLTLGMYYDDEDENCGAPSKEDLNAIMVAPDITEFTECNRNSLLRYISQPGIDCFDDTRHTKDAIYEDGVCNEACKNAFQNSETHSSERCCKWRNPMITGMCSISCEVIDLYGEVSCQSISLHDDDIPCGHGKVCVDSQCVCKPGESCLSKKAIKYYKTFLKVVHERYTSWSEAADVCTGMGGKMLQIWFQETQVSVENILKSTTSYDKFFVGITRDVTVSGQWVEPNGYTVTNFHWYPGEPNENDLGCAVISRHHNYLWIDHTCDGGAGYICEFACTDPVWCVKGTIEYIGDSCKCVCNEGYKGDFCDEFVTSLSPIYSEYAAQSYADAKTQCQQINGRLPGACSQSSYDFFTSYIATLSATPTDEFYIDVTKDGGIWRGCNSKATQFANWDSNEPLASNSCAAVSQITPYEWYSTNCTESHRFVCELPCEKTSEKWCHHGEVVPDGNTCRCECWDGVLGAQCTEYDYNDALYKLILFYEAQESGVRAPGNRITWMNDSFLYDTTMDGTGDLTGGWFDAGDYAKFSFSLTATLPMLAWGVLEFKDAYNITGELNNIYRTLKVATDFILKLHTDEYEFYAYVGDITIEHRTWGRPDDIMAAYGSQLRTGDPINVTNPGSDLAGNVAASLASCYLVFKDIDPTYADTLLEHAITMFEFATNESHQGIYSENTNIENFQSSSYYDELVSGAIWMYKATNDSVYLDKAETLYTRYGLDYVAEYCGWSSCLTATQLLLYLETGNTTYLDRVESSFTNWLPNGTIRYTPGGLAWKSSNNPVRAIGRWAFMALVAGKHNINRDELYYWARSQVNYVLGDSGRSFVSGFGPNPLVSIHHRAGSCPDPPAPCDKAWRDGPQPNGQPLKGAVSGGPDNMDHIFDSRNNYMQTEPSITATGFVSSIAGMLYFRDVLEYTDPLTA